MVEGGYFPAVNKRFAAQSLLLEEKVPPEGADVVWPPKAALPQYDFAEMLQITQHSAAHHISHRLWRCQLLLKEKPFGRSRATATNKDKR